MPRFGSVLSSLQTKIEEARISDLNYELGKLVQDTKCYFSSTFRGTSTLRPNVPKSTSLPIFPGGLKGRVDSCNDIEPITGKYKYRSSFRPPSDEDILGSGGDIIEEEELECEGLAADSSVVERFVRVVEPSSSAAAAAPGKFNTREDIRRKLAFGKSDNKKPQAAAATDLEVCYINEGIDEDFHRSSALTRSQSECVSFITAKCPLPAGQDQVTVAKLLQCKDEARRKIAVEKRNRKFHEVNAFNKLIGKSIEGDLNEELLSQMNTATIQVIVNDFHNKIEMLNEELFKELMKKDELQV